MRLATWNVNGLRARLDLVRLWLDERRPDLVALQELKLTEDLFPHSELEPLGYSAAVVGQKGWNGVAVLARGAAPTVLARELEGQGELGARLVEIELDGLRFASVYCPNGKSVDHEDFPRKLAWFDALASHAARRVADGGAYIVAGDFNIVPEPRDSWSEELLAGSIFHTAEERRRLAALAGLGLRDLYRVHAPTTRSFSWWDYRGGAFHRGQGLRIDLLLGTADVAGRVRKAEIDREFRKKREGLTASDHAPVIVDLEPGTGG